MKTLITLGLAGTIGLFSLTTGANNSLNTPVAGQNVEPMTTNCKRVRTPGGVRVICCTGTACGEIEQQGE